ncbi:hypothetical protein C8J56DRAFT_897306 [Mycena floridula]|nr:hypothetical protein C8J56DRAFT_897306 [Mycena floridula]
MSGDIDVTQLHALCLVANTLCPELHPSSEPINLSLNMFQKEFPTVDAINSHDGTPTLPDDSDCIDIPAFELKREELKRSNEELDEEEMIYFTTHLAARAKRLEVVR